MFSFAQTPVLGRFYSFPGLTSEKSLPGDGSASKGGIIVIIDLIVGRSITG